MLNTVSFKFNFKMIHKIKYRRFGSLTYYQDRKITEIHWNGYPGSNYFLFVIFLLFFSVANSLNPYFSFFEITFPIHIAVYIYVASAIFLFLYLINRNNSILMDKDYFIYKRGRVFFIGYKRKKTPLSEVKGTEEKINDFLYRDDHRLEKIGRKIYICFKQNKRILVSTNLEKEQTAMFRRLISDHLEKHQ